MHEHSMNHLSLKNTGQDVMQGLPLYEYRFCEHKATEPHTLHIFFVRFLHSGGGHFRTKISIITMLRGRRVRAMTLILANFEPSSLIIGFELVSTRSYTRHRCKRHSWL